MKRLALALACVAVACGGEGSARADHGPSSDGTTARLSGTIKVDGSSTVFPITEAVAEEFGALHRDVRVTVGVSGTGGGFKKFTVGETSFSGASRPIQDEEIAACAEHGIEFIELPVAYDGIAVVVHSENQFAQTLTVDELQAMWSAGTTVRTWADVRPGWPDREFRLYAPGQDSGTFDYFTEVINGQSGNCRPDATFSEDDNVLVRGVSGDKDGIGFFGFAYYAENQDKLSLVAVDAGEGPIHPSMDTIADGSYAPLSRPLFIYVSKEHTSRPEVDAFATFYLTEGRDLVREVGYVPLPDAASAAALERYRNRVTGSEKAPG